MALLKRELYRQVKGNLPTLIVARSFSIPTQRICTLSAKWRIWMNALVVRLRWKPPQWISQIISNKAAKQPCTAKCGGC